MQLGTKTWLTVYLKIMDITQVTEFNTKFKEKYTRTFAGFMSVLSDVFRTKALQMAY